MTLNYFYCLTFFILNVNLKHGLTYKKINLTKFG